MLEERWVLLIVIFVWILVIIFNFMMKVRHSPFTPLTDELKKEISTYGLIHYTSADSKEDIEQDKELKPGDSLNGKKKRKVMYSSEEGLVWFYSGRIPFSQLNDKSKSILKEKRCEYAVKFGNFSNVDIDRITYRKKDKAFVYKGNIPLDRLIIEKM